VRFLLTGASGYLAHALALMLVGEGRTVVLASRGPLSPENKVPGCQEVRIDYSSEVSIKKALVDIDVVIHCAGLNASDSATDPDLAFKVNSENTKVLIEHAIGSVACFVYISTIHVYSSNLRGLITEASSTTNAHPYATSHLSGERHVQNNSHFFPEGAFSIRLANTFGVPIEAKSTGWNLVINQLCQQAVRNQQITLNSDPSTERNFIPISSAIQEIKTLIDDKSRPKNVNTFNIGSAQNYNLGQVALIISEVFFKLFSSKLVLNFQHSNYNQRNQFNFSSLFTTFDNYDIEEEIAALLISTELLRPKGLLDE
jgi:UDP-glucose 4-epimerase